MGQVLWVLAYWFAAFVSLLTAAVSVLTLGDNAERFGIMLASLSGSTGAVLGAVLASAVAALRLPFADFMRCTTAVRTVAAGWLVGASILLVGFVVASVLKAGPNGRHSFEGFGRLTDAWLADGSGLPALLGFAALTAILGFGLAEFHTARELAAAGQRSPRDPSG